MSWRSDRFEKRGFAPHSCGYPLNHGIDLHIFKLFSLLLLLAVFSVIRTTQSRGVHLPHRILHIHRDRAVGRRAHQQNEKALHLPAGNEVPAQVGMQLRFFCENAGQAVDMMHVFPNGKLPVFLASRSCACPLTANALLVAETRSWSLACSRKPLSPPSSPIVREWTSPCECTRSNGSGGSCPCPSPSSSGSTTNCASGWSVAILGVSCVWGSALRAGYLRARLCMHCCACSLIARVFTAGRVYISKDCLKNQWFSARQEFRFAWEKSARTARTAGNVHGRRGCSISTALCRIWFDTDTGVVEIVLWCCVLWPTMFT